MSEVHQDNQIANCLNTQLSFMLFADVCVCKHDYCMQVQLLSCKTLIIGNKNSLQYQKCLICPFFNILKVKISTSDNS